MRRLLALLAATVVLAAVPATASADTTRCTIEVSPESGAPTDVYRVNASGFPPGPEGGSLEVRIDVRHLGTREGSVFFVFLVPGITEFYVDINQLAPEEPVEPMAPGRYIVVAETAHEGGCHAVDRFVVN